MNDYIFPILYLALGAGMVYGLYLTVTDVANKILEYLKRDIKGKHTDITLPLRLQAYERMCLFLERISPNNLLLRLTPSAANALELHQILLREIRDEYNHNIAQQMYMSNHAWEQLTSAMNEIVAVINQSAAEVNPEDPATNLAKKIFSHVIEKETQPAANALKVLKEEVRTLF
ncbi:hypothetical protein DYBT9275_01223 [Dyadobacter sp. CECT 9275]|uniref:Uncharacterized protein n=1 Tax=Dyadobacter helix TaxID=2822344 RepID=A0A916JD74_9BACT|nr:hypothetical protein [Dyadobacter sp. CECT 9275]CAG4993728.1 hypothetical protein DYBT9275_01223 [Dyadobacter sp. CECT 9275]